MVYQAVYITDAENKLVFQHLLNAKAPEFSKMWVKLSAMHPQLVAPRNYQDNIYTIERDSGGGSVSSTSEEVIGSYGTDNTIYKYKSQLAGSALTYWCLHSNDSNVYYMEPLFAMQVFETRLHEYFDKEELTITKITNNADRVSIICNYILNGGYYNVAGMYDSRIKEIVPERSDLSKLISSTAHTIQSAVNKQRNTPGFGNGMGQSMGSKVSHIGSTLKGDDSVAPWRNGKNIHNDRNELYADVREVIQVVYQKKYSSKKNDSRRKIFGRRSGHLEYVRGNISGSVDMRCFLTGNPLVEIALKQGGLDIGIPGFHDCVDKTSLLKQEKISKLTFIPPDGRFTLMQYNINLDQGKRHSVGLVHADIEDHLGTLGDEFEVTLNISSSTSVKHIEDMEVMLYFGLSHGNRKKDTHLSSDEEEFSVEQFRIKPLQITHGRLENMSSGVHKRSKWVFDKEVSTGTMPVLRGCVERQRSDEDVKDSKGSDSTAQRMLVLQSINISYKHTGSSNGLQIESINVDTSADLQRNLFKGVKYHTIAKDYQVRV
ncbi:Mu homology domain (MHD) profile [Nakaseomyces glabratus]|nr:Mu homology domain (MHD) profile [Nakaseomyces glabratus]KAH7594915.1 Mu homology domain (MHD) profile [Nakaseomyces glabratus]KAH7610998.1 Mu homology domain (MHD) profile [Nakaseomyces glabratus]